MLGRLALLFVLVPLAELALLIQVGRWMGVWTTVALVFLTGVLGAGLARAEGLRTLWAFRRDLERGEVPGRAIQDGLAILVGGALLLTPGFITDVVGFSLLVPVTRRWLQAAARRRLMRMIEEGSVQVVSGSDLFGGGLGGSGGESDSADRQNDDNGWNGRGRSMDPDDEIVR